MSRWYRQWSAAAGRRVTGMTRREAMRIAAGAAGGVLLSVSGGRAMGADSRKRVVVVGAGFAGLVACHELAALGHQVILLEARPGVGGRVLSLSNYVPGKVVEGGGELIGANHPVWLSLAERYQLSLDELPEEADAVPLFLQGKQVQAEQIEPLWEATEEIVESLNELADDVDPAMPWTANKASAWDKASLQDFLDQHETPPLARYLFAVLMGADAGVAAGWQSLLGVLSMIQGGGGERFWTETERYRCAGGNQQLAVKLYESVIEGQGEVQMNCPVREIDTESSPCRVTDANGKVWEADHVILAVPPSVWPRIRFRPNLPANFEPQMGTNTKLLVRVRSRVWREKGFSPEALSDQMVNMTWESTSNQGDDGEFCLVGFSGADAAVEACGLPPGERVERLVQLIGQWYPGLAEAVVQGQFMNWPSAPWAGASYSFPAPGQVTSLGPQLRNGFERLHLAGEHCSYAYPGYMEGALQTGAWAARQVHTAR